MSATAPKYLWKVDGGDIADGQGTNALEVRRKTERLHVTLTISGLGEGCDQTMAETGHFDPPPVPLKLAEFSGSLTSRPHEDLETIARKAKENPTSSLYVIISGDGKHPLKTITAKRNLLVQRLSNVLEPAYRWVLVEHLHSTKDHATIWLVPAGATPPN